jgi:hypothetical protein
MDNFEDYLPVYDDPTKMRDWVMEFSRRGPMSPQMERTVTNWLEGWERKYGNAQSDNVQESTYALYRTGGALTRFTSPQMQVTVQDWLADYERRGRR